MNEKKQESKGLGSLLANRMKTATEIWESIGRMWSSSFGISGTLATSKNKGKSRAQESWETALRPYQALFSVMSENGDMKPFFQVINTLPKILWNILQMVWDGFLYQQKQYQNAFKKWTELCEKEFEQCLNVLQLKLPRFCEEKLNTGLDRFTVFQTSVLELLYLFHLPIEQSFKVIQEKLTESADNRKSSMNAEDFYQIWVKVLEGNYTALFKSSEYKQAMDKILASMGEIMGARQEFLQDILNVFQKRETLILAHAAELKEMVIELKKQIRERKQAEKALRESKERYRAVVGDMPAMICRFLPDGKLTFVSDSYCSYFDKKKEELTGQNFFQFIPEEEQEKVRKHFTTLNTKNPMITYEHQVIAPDGNIRWQQWTDRALFDEQGHVVEYQSIGKDITEEKLAQDEKAELEKQLRHAERMEAIGTLAGGIAHDFNNLLMGIQGNASLILLDKGSTHPDYGRLKNIELYVQNGANLTRQLLDFARGRTYEVKATNLNDLVKKSSKMFSRTKKEITIHPKYQKDIWTVEVDQGQIQQVFLNLYINAWQAMPGGGDFYVQTENAFLDENDAKLFNLEPGRYVKISMTDTGVGMDEATQKRIFDPFFTTKEMNKGTGLGLASVYGVIKNHGGFIDVSSEKDKGSTFYIYLPASGKEFVDEKKPPERLLRGIETILLVDDEDMVIDVGRQMMEKLGYKVLIAQNGKRALQIFNANKDKIDIVILDMIMPKMGGNKVYQQLKKTKPDVKVLLSSGYSINDQAKDLLAHGCNGFLQKPFNMIDLSQVLREILDEE